MWSLPTPSRKPNRRWPPINRLEQTWQDNLTKYGDSKKARTETVKAVKALEGVKEAGVSSDGVNIWIEFTSGIRGGLMLSQKKTGNGVRSTVGSVAGGSVPPISAGTGNLALNTQNSCNQMANVGGEASDSATVGNCKVLIWDRYWSEQYLDDEIPDMDEDPYYQIFINANKNNKKFSVSRAFDTDATVDSLRTLTDYGTVIIKTHSMKGKEGRPVFDT